jgi:5,10-methylenetetrahydromethanopterin reductase
VQRIGKKEDPVGSFEKYLTRVQSYLRGEAVDRDGFESRLEWLSEMKVPKVPVEVAATGRRVIAAAARTADRICFAVGADPDHLGAALAHARSAAESAGRDPGSIVYGAFINCVVNVDVAVARDALRGAVATFARFSAFRGSDPDTLPAPLRRAVLYIREHYDMRDHTRTGVAHTAGIADDFVDWFAIAGPPEVAVRRLRALAALGLDFVHVIPGSTGVARDVAIASVARLAQDVLPALRT